MSATRSLVGWNAGVALYLLLVYILIARCNMAQIRDHAAREDEGRVGILVLTVFAALASLGAIVVELHGAAASRVSEYQRCRCATRSWRFRDSSNARKITNDYGQGRRPLDRPKNYANFTLSRHGVEPVPPRSGCRCRDG